MLPVSTSYLINSIKSLSYSYDPDGDCWRAEHFRGNKMRSFGTRIKVKITKKGKVKARVRHLEAPPQTGRHDAFELVDSTKIKFEDEGFKNELKSLKTD